MSHLSKLELVRIAKETGLIFDAPFPKEQVFKERRISFGIAVRPDQKYFAVRIKDKDQDEYGLGYMTPFGPVVVFMYDDPTEGGDGFACASTTFINNHPQYNLSDLSSEQVVEILGLKDFKL